MGAAPESCRSTPPLSELGLSLGVLHDQLPATVWTVDREMMITSSFGEGLRRRNWPPNHTAGKTLFEYFKTEDPDHPVIAAHRRALSGEAIRYEGRTSGAPTEVTVQPVTGPAGDVTGCVAISVDISILRHTQALLQQSDDRFRQFGDSVDMVVWMSDSSLRRLQYLSPAYESVWGRDRATLIDEPDTFIDAIVPEDRERVIGAIDRHRRGEASEITYRIHHPYSGVRWIRDRSFPIRNADGEVYRVAGIAEDITERCVAERLVETQRLILEMIALGAPFDDVLEALCMEIEQAVPGGVCSVMRVEDEVLRLHTAPSVPPELRPLIDGIPFGVGSCGSAAQCGEMVIVTDTHDDARWAPVLEVAKRCNIRSCWSIPIFGRGRATVGTVAISHSEVMHPTPIQLHVLQTAAHIAGIAFERHRTNQRQQFMMRELDHRVKNNLALVMAIAQQTAAATSDVDDFKRAFNGRLESLAIAHESLASTEWTGAKLSTIVRRIIGPYDDGGRDRSSVDGPEVMLPADAASPVCMVLHELVTNATKYGSLSDPGGRVEIKWSRGDTEDATRKIILHWREADGPAVKPPTRHGYGISLMEGLVRRQLRGELTMDFQPAGLACEIVIPLAPPAPTSPLPPSSTTHDQP